MYLSSWSGGKDSCFACYKAIKSGIKISGLLHFVREFNLHGVDPGMIRLQAELIEMPLIQRKVVSDDFESEFKDVVRSVNGKGLRGVVFGDIYLEPHKEWVERVCGDLGIEAREPLWGMETEKLMREFLDEGFRTIIVSGNERLIDREWIGRFADREFIEYMKEKKLDVCGENGEYHSFVVSGPSFRGEIDIREKEVISRNGFWFLDIKDHIVIRKMQ